MGLRHPPDRPLRSQQMILAHHLRKALGPQPIGQRARRLGGEAGGFKEVAHERKPNRGEGDAHAS